MDIGDFQDIEKRTEAQKKLIEENVAKHREVLNRLFSTEDGRFLYKVMAKYCGIFSVDKRSDSDTIRENIGKRKVLLELILPYLEKDVRIGLHD